MRDFRLSFCDSTGEPRKWTVLVARNARGKTTLLQAIALAAAGPTLANSLARSSLSSFFDRRLERAPAVEIAVEFGLPALTDIGKRPHPTRECPGWSGPDAPARVVSTLRLESGQSIIRGRSWYGGLDQAPESPGPDPIELVRGSAAPWWFVAGYGVDRRLTLESRKVDRPAEERLRSLFEPVPPTGLGFADRQSYGTAFATAFNRLLRRVILAQARTVPLITNLELRGAGGVSLHDLAEKDKFEFEIAGKPRKMPATYLSHGYQSTLAWISDLVGHFLLDLEGKGITEPRHLSGLVLIDELDLFLHPDWQTDFVDALSLTFPNLQFVATTHSPLLVSKLRPEQVVELCWDADGNIEPRTFAGDPRLMTATELYRQLFNIADPPPTTLARTLSRYEYLRGDPERNDAEEQELWLLRQQLADAEVRDVVEPTPRKRSAP